MIHQRQKTSNARKLFDLAHCGHKRSGVAMVELALILPILILVMVLAIDLSRFLIVSISLNNALNQGVATGAITPLSTSATNTWKAAIENTIQQSLSQYSWYQPGNLVVTIPTPSTTNGLVDSQGFRSLMVSLKYRSDLVFPWPGLAKSYELNTSLKSDQIR